MGWEGARCEEGVGEESIEAKEETVVGQGLEMNELESG